MTSEELWEQLMDQRIVEAIKPNLTVVGELEEEQEEFLEQLNDEQKQSYEELLDGQLQNMFDEQKLIYMRGFFDGLRLAHAAF